MMDAFDFSFFHLAFSTIIFTFIVHHSIPGFFSPVREQLKARRYFCLGFFFTFLLLGVESTLACLAFQGYNCEGYPIGLSVRGFSELGSLLCEFLGPSRSGRNSELSPCFQYRVCPDNVHHSSEQFDAPVFYL